ncbi:MAG: hypothetical protein D6732_29020 [Methanobacteriota archaeon]|nr:MAG: hypothetical protein D6732_29020 [Euryarchaeota archaeon]
MEIFPGRGPEIPPLPGTSLQESEPIIPCGGENQAPVFELPPFSVPVGPGVEDAVTAEPIGPGIELPNVFLAQKIARKIAQGHAYDKHVVKQGEFPEVRSRAEFERLIADVISNPEASKSLSRGRRAYWKGNVVVITNPADPDGGTAFRPVAGKAYYDNLR